MNPNSAPSKAASAPDLAVVETALAGLTETAPIGFAHSARVAVGVADDYTVLDSPIGPLWIAWNGRGVAAVESAPDDRAFEVRFQARTGRPIRRVESLPADLARAIERRLGGDRRARISAAIQPYGRTSPRGISRALSQTACSNSVVPR
jgi:hypothetical protein